MLTSRGRIEVLRPTSSWGAGRGRSRTDWGAHRACLFARSAPSASGSQRSLRLCLGLAWANATTRARPQLPQAHMVIATTSARAGGYCYGWNDVKGHRHRLNAKATALRCDNKRPPGQARASSSWIVLAPRPNHDACGREAADGVGSGNWSIMEMLHHEPGRAAKSKSLRNPTSFPSTTCHLAPHVTREVSRSHRSEDGPVFMGHLRLQPDDDRDASHVSQPLLSTRLAIGSKPVSGLSKAGSSAASHLPL